MVKARFAKQMARVEKKRRRVVIRNITKLAFKIGGEAQRAAPIETGELRASMSIDVIKELTGVTANIWFLQPYAERQHEGVGFNHPIGGSPKYLETAVKANENEAMLKIGRLK